MFLELRMKNFRQHRDRVVSYSPGLTVLRGNNEKGKSGIFEAIGYALFGSEALRESLDDVVTWGEKVSSLKVELRLQVNTSIIDIRRGKSGAELDVDGKLVATGQKEVTKFMEGLFGAAPKVAGKLMMASQTALRGALADGPTATTQLIEQLSNFQLIDEVIALVTENLPSGSAVAVEQQIRTLAGQLEASKPEPLDVAGLESSAQALAAQADREGQELAQAQAELPAATQAAEQARRNAAALDSAQRKLGDARAGAERTQAELAQLNPVCSVSVDQLQALRQAARVEEGLVHAKTAWSALAPLKLPEIHWEGSRADFDAAVRKNAADSQALADALRRLDVEVAKVTGRLIKEQACAFCGKDLKDVPEVQVLNSELGTRLKELAAQREVMAATAAFLREERDTLSEIREAATRFDRLLNQCSVYVKVLDTTVPASWEWTGPDVTQPAGAAAAALATAEAERRRADLAQGRATALREALARYEAEAAAADAQVAGLAPKVASDRSTGLESDLKTKVAYHQGRINELAAQRQAIWAQISSAQQVHAVQVKAYAQLQAQLKAAEVQLEELQLNNVLLKKLRAARPKVADKLWGTILATVAHYFSQIRGVQSTVTKADDGFRVDGKPVAGLSGSTLDALGLSIRWALTKTFLPNIDFMLLDEPGAACDDDREANMLGAIATSGFAQTILVTHSDLADTFADQVITL